MCAVNGFGRVCVVHCVLHALCVWVCAWVCVFVSVVNLGLVFYVSLQGLCSVCPARDTGVAVVGCGMHRGPLCGEGVVICIRVRVV